MQYGMYVSAAGALANSYRQDVVANNLANVDTVAFKRDLAWFQARPTAAQHTGQARYSTALLEGLGGGVFALPTRTDFSPASLEEVGDPYSVALTDQGFFQVQKGQDMRLTRDGRFTLDAANQLVTAAGHYPVLSDQGSPITIDRELDFSVNDTGVISQGGSAVARLGIVDVEDQNQLQKDGNNLYRLDGEAAIHSIDSRIKQGFIEQSGINPTRELIDMIQAQRMYQLNMSMITLQDQTLGMAVNRLGSLNM